MSRRTPIATRTATLLPSTTLVRSARVDGTLVAATRGGGSLSARVEASFGIDGLGARSRADAMPLLPLSRQGADASFRKLAVEAALVQPVGAGVQIAINARAQTAFGKPLVNAEQIGSSEEHTSELQSLMRISYAAFCLKKKTNRTTIKK